LAGIFTAATYISQDARLRKEFYNSAASQLRLFRGIGISEMHRELEKKVEIMSKKTEFLEEEDRWELKEEDVKQALDDVLNEVYSKNKKQ
jgi:methionyl-tRNA synthetase